MFREKRRTYSGMLVFIFLIPLHAVTARFLISKPVLKVMYGNIGVISDMQIPEPDTEDSRRAHVDMDFTIGDNDDFPDFEEFLDEVEDMQQWNIKLNSTALELDIRDLFEASKTLDDLKKDLEVVVQNHSETRRQLQVRLPNEVDTLSADPVALREWYYMKLCLTYLIHIRFQVDAATRQKMANQIYSGYRIGYLFHKMIKTKTQMYRLMDEWQSMSYACCELDCSHGVSTCAFKISAYKYEWATRLIQNRPNWRTKTHSFKLLLQLYERMLNLDVDMKDTVEMIKLAFFKREAFLTELASSTPGQVPKK